MSARHMNVVLPAKVFPHFRFKSLFLISKDFSSQIKTKKTNFFTLPTALASTSSVFYPLFSLPKDVKECLLVISTEDDGNFLDVFRRQASKTENIIKNVPTAGDEREFES